MAPKCSAISAAVAVAILAMFMAMWAGPGCSGDTATASACGCSNMPYYGGQEFSYQGQTASLYTEAGCAGTPYQVFEDTQACGDFGWRSINIDC